MDGIVVGRWDRPARPPGPLDPGRVRTNFVLFKVERDRAAFLAALRARGVVMVEYPHGQVRAVTHYGVTAADIETTIAATRAALAETGPGGSRSGSARPPPPDRAAPAGAARPTARPPTARPEEVPSP